MNINMAILVDAKKEYTIQLKNIIKPFIYRYFENTLNSLKGSNILKQFQKVLTSVPSWDNSILDNKTSDITNIYDFELIDELLTAIFISNVRILTAVKTQNISNDLNIKIPELNIFIHKCYHESAKEIYKNPFLFVKTNLSSRKIQENMRISLDIIDMSIDNAIRQLLPLKQILNTYINSSVGEEYSDDILDIEISGDEDVEELVEPTEENVETVEEQIEENVEIVEEPIEEPVEKNVETVEKPVEENVGTVEDPVEEPIEENVEEPIEENVEEPIEENVEEPIEENVEEPIEENVEEQQEEIVDEQDKEINTDNIIDVNQLKELFHIIKEDNRQSKPKIKKKGVFYKKRKVKKHEEHTFF